MPFVSELHIYPLKSGQGLSLSQVTFTARGPALDRQWMVINSKHRFITQRQKTKMCLIETKVEQHTLILNAPEMPELRLSPSQHQVDVTVWKDSVIALDCGDQAAMWICDYLKKRPSAWSIPIMHKINKP